MFKYFLVSMQISIEMVCEKARKTNLFDNIERKRFVSKTPK